MKIRPAVENDLLAIAMLHRQMQHEMNAMVLSGFGGDELEDTLLQDVQQYVQSYAAALASKDYILLVACQGETTVGFLSAVFEEYADPLLTGPYMTIEYLAVDPDHRGSGVATALIKDAERRGQKRGAEYADILVWATNASAINLYEKAGYQILEVRMARSLK